MADAAAFIDTDLDRNTLLQAFHMADHANGLAAGVECVEGIERNFQGVAIKRAEAFVEEKRVDRRLVTDQVGQGQRQRQTNEKTLAAGEGSGIPADIPLPGVDNFQLQFALCLAAQAVARMEPEQVAVGETEQVVEGEALGKFPVLVAACGTDQAIQSLSAVFSAISANRA